MEDKAQEAFEKARQEASEGDWRDAAAEYKNALFHAKNPVIKANAP